MKIANEWKDYKILDMADGQKLEKWGDVVLSRPDPQIIWKDKSYPKKWNEIKNKFDNYKSNKPCILLKANNIVQKMIIDLPEDLRELQFVM